MEHFEIVKIEERDTESSEQNYVETETFGNGNSEIASSTTGNCEIENFLIDSFDVENTAICDSEIGTSKWKVFELWTLKLGCL